MEALLFIVVIFVIIIICCSAGSKAAEREKQRQQQEINELVKRAADAGIYINPYRTSAPAPRNGPYRGGFRGYCRMCNQQIFFSTYDVIPAPYPHGTCPYCHNWVAVF